MGVFHCEVFSVTLSEPLVFVHLPWQCGACKQLANRTFSVASFTQAIAAETSLRICREVGTSQQAGLTWRRRLWKGRGHCLSCHCDLATFCSPSAGILFA